MRRLAKTVLALGWVSFFTDLSSEMIYPLLPLFLIQLGVGALSLGLIEGIAESTAALVKLFSGFWTDAVKKRKPFLLFGYGVAGFARPLIGLAYAWPFVLILRFVDRVGKGLRSAPRDALIADVTPSHLLGRAYGFHRSMDHAGSVLGPLAAALLLEGLGFELRDVFLCAALPAVMVMVLLVAGVKEPEEAAPLKKRSAFLPWRTLPTSYRRYLTSLGVFTLGNCSDAFLLLALATHHFSATETVLLWAAHGSIKLVATYGAGWWADLAGRRTPIVIGWAAHVVVYLCFALAAQWIVAAFLIYGLVQGLTEPAEKALVADLAERDKRGGAFGYFHLVQGVGALPASLVFGLLWSQFGMAIAFGVNAGIALIGLLVFVLPGSKNET